MATDFDLLRVMTMHQIAIWITCRICMEGPRVLTTARALASSPPGASLLCDRQARPGAGCERGGSAAAGVALLVGLRLRARGRDGL
jgi:hypothetical protein